MDFSVGDKVMYSRRGAGRITAVEHKELVDGFEHYYVIEIPSDRLTVRVPVQMAEDVGLRPVVSEAKLEQVLAVLGEKPRALPGDYKKRQEQIDEKLKTGHPISIAEAVRDLSWREVSAYLTKRDADLLNQGRDLLAEEISMTTGDDVNEVHATIDSVLLSAMAPMSN